MPVLPQEIGPYRIIRPLGRGGMGTVSLAEDSRLGRLVALKAFSGPEARGDDARRQLLAEARAAAALAHPNIAVVHDVLDVDEQVVIVFEYVEGGTLASRIARGPLPVATALAIAMQLAEGLICAHRHGIIHRDLKPSNVVITADGVAKILDFGIARAAPIGPATDPGQARTTASFVGTIGYAAPEQCLGDGVDARADIFALGVVLFEMLTGRRPFPGADATTVLRAMLHDEPPHVTSVVRDVPPALDVVIRRALSRDRTERPQTARELGELLLAAVPGATTRLPAVSPKGLAWAIAAVLMVALGTGSLVSSLLSESPAAPSVRPPVVAVMPLTNASGDAAKEYLALGVVESLITRLASLPSVTVLSRSAVAEARARRPETAALASELDATYLVDGSVQQAGGLLRITLTLIRRDGSVAWADTVEGRLDDIFGLQTRLASALGEALEVQLSAADRASLARQSTMNAEALASYWRGRTLLERRDVKGNIDAALANFDGAIRLDDRYADAHAARGETLWMRYLQSRNPEDARSAVEAGTTALRLDPDRASVRFSLALTLSGTGRLGDAAEELHRALVLQPNYDDARRQLGNVLARQGKLDEAIAEFRKAIALRPNYWAHYNALGTSLLQAGRYDEAAEAFVRITVLQPDNATAYLNLGIAFHFRGRYDEALASYERAIAIRPSASSYSNLGTLHHEQGQFAKAVEAHRAALTLRPNVAATHRNLGDALRRLGRPVAARAAYLEAMRLLDVDLSVNPRDAHTLAAWAVYAAKAGEHQKAQARLTEAQRLAPDDIQVHYRAAVVHAIGKRPGEAVRALERAVAGGYSTLSIAKEEDFESLRTRAEFLQLTAPAAGATEKR